MGGNQLRRWSLVLGVAVGCNAKLSVTPLAAGGAAGDIGAAGHAGDDGQSPGGADTTSAGFAGEYISPPAQGGGGGQDTQMGGAGGELAIRGNVGQKCISAALIKVGSGVALADVQTLDHCRPGLSCGPAGKCILIPACNLTSNECRVFSDGSGGTGGVGGMDGVGGTMAGGPIAGGPGQGYVQDETGVTALLADETYLYWVEHGTRDSLGNYQNDGKLVAMGLSDGKIKTVTSGLLGPVALGLTSTQAYVSLDGGGVVGTPVHQQLVRVPLNGGEVQLVQEGNPQPSPLPFESFASAGGTAYWNGSDGIYSQPQAAAATPVLFAAGSGMSLHADAANLYLVLNTSTAYNLSRVPLAGGAVQPLDLEPRESFGLSGEFMYSLESLQGGTLLARAPKSGGAWQRTQALGDATEWARFQILGERFFFEWRGPSSRALGVTVGSLTGTKPPVHVLEPQADSLLWVGTAYRLFWSDHHRIYSSPLPQP